MYDVNIHMGAPKCMSTSIQLAFNSAENIDYLGFIPCSNSNDWYADNTMRRFLDCDIKYANRITFMQKKEHYEKYFSDFIKSKINREKWISCENLSTRFTLEEVDCYEKLQRLLSTMKDSRVALHMIFRKYASAVYSMYSELVSRKYSENFADFLRELHFFNDLGVVDHIMPSRIFDTFALLKNEFPHVQLFCYFPMKRSEHFFDPNELSKLWKIEISNIPQNQSRFGVECLRNLNKHRYSANALSNLMELHRYGLAHGVNDLVDYWRDRKIRKILIEQSQKAFEPEDNTSYTFENSSFFQILRENHPKHLPNCGVTVYGDVNNLW